MADTPASEFGDFEPDDAYCEGDAALEDLDWDQIVELQARIDALPPPGHPDRHAAAVLLQAEMNQEAS
ncbi:MAG: hypothetical protein AAGA42_11245 [Actinomycetota bacterium]